MGERGGDLDFPEKPLGSDGGGDLVAQHLDGDGPVVPDVLGQVDRGHAPVAELPLDQVPAGQGGRNPQRVAHPVPKGLGMIAIGARHRPAVALATRVSG